MLILYIQYDLKITPYDVIFLSLCVRCSHSSGHGGEADVANVTVVHGITGIRISQKV